MVLASTSSNLTVMLVAELGLGQTLFVQMGDAILITAQPTLTVTEQLA
jgi:hypothetical protein